MHCFGSCCGKLKVKVKGIPHDQKRDLQMQIIRSSISCGTGSPPRRLSIARGQNTDKLIKQLIMMPDELSHATYGLSLTDVTDRKYVAQDFFEFGPIIGSGSTSVVFRATFLPTDKIYAVKYIKNFRQYKVMVMREIAILKSLKRCPFAVLYHSHFSVDTHLYIVMEYLQGGSLKQILGMNNVLPPSVTREYMKQISSALMYLHRRKLVHRDICSENICLTSSANLRIIDFGVTKTIEDPNGEHMTDCGKPAYRAPESFLGKSCSSALDWWSMGVLLYRCVTGQLPFKAYKLTEAFQSVTKLPVIYPDWAFENTNELDFCKRLLTKDPKKRLGTRDGEIQRHIYFTSVYDWDIEGNMAEILKSDVDEGRISSKHFKAYVKLMVVINPSLNASVMHKTMSEIVSRKLYVPYVRGNRDQ